MRPWQGPIVTVVSRFAGSIESSPSSMLSSMPLLGTCSAPGTQSTCRGSPPNSSQGELATSVR